MSSLINCTTCNKLTDCNINDPEHRFSCTLTGEVLSIFKASSCIACEPYGSEYSPGYLSPASIAVLNEDSEITPVCYDRQGNLITEGPIHSLVLLLMVDKQLEQQRRILLFGDIDEDYNLVF